jgi:hypothetical protein
MTAASRITSAQLRALHSVENRQCFRTFTPSGNTLRSKDGYSPQVLWNADLWQMQSPSSPRNRA